MNPTLAKLGPAILAAGIAAGVAPIARGQIATLDKGHQLLVNSGLQIWGCDTGASSFTYGNLTAANMNAVMWSHGQSNPGVLSAGQKWGKWVDYTASPATALNATENAHYADLVAIQVGDEQQSDLESPTSLTTTWYQNARNGNYFNDKLLYVNSFFINSDAAYATFIANANPDAISFDAYPFGTGGFQPINWLGKAQQFRRHALGSYIGANNNAARPYGLYLQAYSSTTEGRRDPGDLEMRWQQFTAWTLGYTFVDNFTVGGATSLFNGGNMSSPNQPRYNQFKESARQSLNLGPALTKLISYSNGVGGGGTSIVRGRDPSGNLNGLPISWKDFNVNDAPPNQRYLTSVSAVNLGTKNNGQPGDVYIGFFNPLHASFGDPAGTTYFMVTNALGAYLQDPNLLVTDVTQRVTLNFDFGASSINSLQRLRRSDGQVEIVPLAHLTANQYRLEFDLEGGTGDLFKYNDGSPFVGVPFTASSLYWDNDGVAANNNIVTGAGLGGSGNWDTSANKWYNGVANGPWGGGNDAVFSGAAGTVTLSAPQSASSLTFKTSGYTVTGSTLTMTGPTATVDAGVSATIGSVVAGSAGLVKNGPGTLNLAVNNTYAGGTTINDGVLGITSGALGVNPAAPAVNVAINNGATLRFNQDNLTLTAQRQIALGSGGGVIDTAVNNGILSVLSGGALTKTGAGALTLSAANSHAATTINGGAIVVSADANLGADPVSFMPGNITLDGGTLRFGADFDLSNSRGITMGAGGGTIDTQGFTNPSGYTQPNGIRGGNLTKIGSGTFFMNPSSGLNADWTGNLILKEGIWKISERGGLPFNPPTGPSDPVIAGQITFEGGTLQIANTIPNVTNGRRGITVAAGGGTFDTQGFTFNWAGPLAGDVTSATLTKIGSGTLQFNTNTVPAPSTYTGNLQVAEGTLVINGGTTGTAMGPLASIHLTDAAGVTLTISGTAATTIGSLSGGGVAGGNVTLNASLVTGGNNNSTSFDGLVSGSGGLTKAGSGTFVLSRGNSYGGGTSINNGTLLVNNSTGSGTGTGPVAVSPGATLGGTGAIAGAVTINTGGHIAPGASIESLDVGSLTLSAGSILDFELDTIVGVDTSDLINVTLDNGLTINGVTLNLANAGSMTNGTYTLIDYSGTLNGSVSNIALGTTPAGFSFGLVNNSSDTSIDLVVTALGDFNGDGRVDAADYIVLRRGLGSTYTQADYDAWRAHFGETAGSGSSATTNDVVPEPATALLFFTAPLAMRTRRRAANLYKHARGRRL